MNMRKKAIILLLTIALIGIAIYNIPFVGYTYINIVDESTDKDIAGAGVSLFPKVHMIASPGTDTGGAFIYSTIVPTPVYAHIGAKGYKSKNMLLILWKGRMIKVPLYLQ